MEKMTTNLGIIGFGRFGKLFSKILSDDFSILVYDKYKDNDTIINEAASIGIKLTPATLPEAASCKNVVFCVPILSFSDALQESVQYFTKNATIIDVLSVKKYPSDLMTSIIHNDIEILLTHPMFGPNTSTNIKGRTIIICPDKTSENILAFWRGYFEKKGLIVEEMSCEEHDRITAYSLCITQLLGRALDKVGLVSSKEYGFDMDTEVFKNMLEMRKIACDDTWELYQGLQLKNPFARKMREELMEALKEIDNNLYLFSWDEIPGRDSEILLEFLKKSFDIVWIDSAKIEKIYNGKTIRVYTDTNFLTLRLNDEKTKVTFIFDDGRTTEILAKCENGKLNISKIY